MSIKDNIVRKVVQLDKKVALKYLIFEDDISERTANINLTYRKSKLKKILSDVLKFFKIENFNSDQLEDILEYFESKIYEQANVSIKKFQPKIYVVEVVNDSAQILNYKIFRRRKSAEQYFEERIREENAKEYENYIRQKNISPMKQNILNLLTRVRDNVYSNGKITIQLKEILAI